MLLQVLKQLMLGLLALSHAFYKFLRARAAQIQHHHQAWGNEEEGNLVRKLYWRRAAIVSLHSDPNTLPFVTNLLNGLAENGFFVVIVAAKKLPPDLKSTLLSHCHCLIEKFSITGDFSSVKTGWEWIKKRDDLQNVDTLAIVNDGLYYPRRISSTIGQMLTLEDDWLSLFENSPAPLQAQSFFQIFRAPVFKADAFENFWHNDALTPARLRGIVTGETGLASALLKAGLTSKAYYNAARVQADILAALENDQLSASLRDALNLTLGFERKSKNSRLPLRAQDVLTMPASDVARRIGKLAEGNNPEHTIGLLCNYLYQAPVKRDICHHDTLTARDLLALAQGFSIEEKKTMGADLARPSVSANLASIRKMPQRFLQTARRS